MTPVRPSFRTSCCGQLFHTECLVKRKEQTIAKHGGVPTCPMCRSQQPTGLTPARRVTGYVRDSVDPERQATISAAQRTREAMRRAAARRTALNPALNPSA